MGAFRFMVAARGATAEEAFAEAVEHAKWEHGNGGYTGTIAEKTSVVVISDDPPLTGHDAPVLAQRLLDADDPRIEDKWGPAGAIRMVGGTWLLFGWASA